MFWKKNDDFIKEICQLVTNLLPKLDSISEQTLCKLAAYGLTFKRIEGFEHYVTTVFDKAKELHEAGKLSKNAIGYMCQFQKQLGMHDYPFVEEGIEK